MYLCALVVAYEFTFSAHTYALHSKFLPESSGPDMRVLRRSWRNLRTQSGRYAGVWIQLPTCGTEVAMNISSRIMELSFETGFDDTGIWSQSMSVLSSFIRGGVRNLRSSQNRYRSPLSPTMRKLSQRRTLHMVSGSSTVNFDSAELGDRDAHALYTTFRLTFYGLYMEVLVRPQLCTDLRQSQCRSANPYLEEPITYDLNSTLTVERFYAYPETFSRIHYTGVFHAP
jgi:hypothetical protein